MLKYKIPQIVTLTRIHLPQIVLKKRILIANYLTIRILFGAANGIRTLSLIHISEPTRRS